MTKVKKSKVTIKATKVDNNGKVEIKNKTFSKNNKKFQKDVANSKELLEGVSEYEFAVASDVYDEKRRKEDVEDFKSVIKDTEKIFNDHWLDAKLNYAVFLNSIKGLGIGIIALFKGFWYSIKYLFSK